MPSISPVKDQPPTAETAVVEPDQPESDLARATESAIAGTTAPPAPTEKSADLPISVGAPIALQPAEEILNPPIVNMFAQHVVALRMAAQVAAGIQKSGSIVVPDTAVTESKASAAAYYSTGKPVLDLFTQLVRTVPQSTVEALMTRAWNTNPVHTLKIVFLNR